MAKQKGVHLFVDFGSSEAAEKCTTEMAEYQQPSGGERRTSSTTWGTCFACAHRYLKMDNGADFSRSATRIQASLMSRARCLIRRVPGNAALFG
jgi:hypothetical protein